MKRFLWSFVMVLLVAALVCGMCAACAEDDGYIGNMQVVNCNEWVSLRKRPSAASARLLKVSLGSVVANCRRFDNSWIYAEFDGCAGYIMSQYLQPADGSLIFNAMLITRYPDGAPIYATIDSTSPFDTIPPDTVVRNCHMMDNGRVGVQWGDRYGFIIAEHAQVYNEILHYPRRFTMLCSLFGADSFGPAPCLGIDDADAFPLQDYDCAQASYDMDGYEDPDFPPLRFVLHSDETLWKVHLYSVELMDTDDMTGQTELQLTLEDMLHRLDPQHPLCVTGVMYGSTPNLAVGYEDPQGMYHFAFIEMSGEDGSLLLREF